MLGISLSTINTNMRCPVSNSTLIAQHLHVNLREKSQKAGDVKTVRRIGYLLRDAIF